MRATGSDPTTRPAYQSQSLDHLIAATRLDPNSSIGLYHLAFCQAEARSIEPATESVRGALELDSRNVQAWHLLALLLAAQSDWAGAAKAGEAGVSVWEQEDEVDREEDEGPLRNPSENNPTVEAKDFAAPSSSSTSNNMTQTSAEPLLLPSGAFATSHMSTASITVTPLSRTKRLEEIIRLRMTLNIIAEKVQGPEVAMHRQQELFAFFSARSGKQRGQGFARGMASTMSAASFVERRRRESFASVDQPGLVRGSGDAPVSGELC